MASYMDRHSISPDIRDNVDVKRLSPEEYRRYQQIANGNDPDFTDMQNHMWRLAQYASRMAKQNYNFDIPPHLIYKQWSHESGANFDANEDLYPVHNYGGLTQTEPNDLPQPESNSTNFYRKFNNDRDYVNAYINDFIKHYSNLNGVTNEDDYARILHDYGYFQAEHKENETPEEYAAKEAAALAAYQKDMRGIYVPNSYVGDDYDFDISHMANATINPKRQTVLAKISPSQNDNSLLPNLTGNFSVLPYQQELKSLGAVKNPYAEYGNPYSAVYQQNSSTPQVQQPRPSTSSLLNLPSYQNTPQVDMSRWTPYNNVQFTPQGIQSRDNFVAGVRNWARNLFGGRSE